MSDYVDRADEYREWIADDERRDANARNGRHPDDDGPTEPLPEPARNGKRKAKTEPEEILPKLWNAADLKAAAPPRWLAQNRLQRAALNLLIGDEGIGKSLLWVYIVAAVTTGNALPEFGIPPRRPSHVVLVCAEDDWSSVVVPRLQVAGADLAMVRVICEEFDGSGAPLFPRDENLILRADPQPALVVVDCWLDTVPSCEPCSSAGTRSTAEGARRSRWGTAWRPGPGRRARQGALRSAA
jgi:hypothetical protein